QMIRMLMTGLVFYLREVVGVGSMLVGGIALALFLVAFLAPLLPRLLGYRASLAVTAGGLGLVRATEQYVTSVPADLALAMVGTVLFLWSLPLWFSVFRGRGGERGGLWAIAFLMGIGGDTAIKGVFGTLDLSWERGAAPDVLVVMLVVAQWALLGWLARRETLDAETPHIVRALPLLALGPVLALELLLFQNIGQQTVFIDWPQPAVYSWLLTGTLAGIVASVALVRWGRPLPRPFILVLGALLVLMVIDEPSGALAILIALAGPIVVALLLVTIAVCATSAPGRQGMVGFGMASSGGMVLFLATIFLYYATYDIDLLLPRQAIPPLAAGLVVIAAMLAGPSLARVPRAVPLPWATALPALLLLPALTPLQLVSWDEPSVAEGAGFPVRVMSYNLHQGFDVEGRLGMEALAQVIEGEQPDIVALQEVSRGWLVDGSLDMLTWLSQRLGMKYVSGPTADSLWGNAVLSRYPMRNVQTHTMPNNPGLRIKRGFISLEVEIGGGMSLNIIATHLHAGADEGFHRVTQVEAMLGFWDGAGSTVLLGDLNARPSDPEMILLAQGGLKDAFIDSGAVGSGYTSRPDDPFQRIDYIWVSGDLMTRDFSIPQSRASDHFGVAVTLDG
ncbi:MAG: endonuclease/exonuclease/phosphatase family protein, partial [Dehalococcoidia bacterium]